MSLHEANEWYKKNDPDGSFPQDLYLHLTYGHVIVTPSSLLMGRPVVRGADPIFVDDISYTFTNPDCWLVWFAIGISPVEFLRQMPYELPYIAWVRHGKKLSVYETKYLQSRLRA